MNCSLLAIEFLFQSDSIVRFYFFQSLLRPFFSFILFFSSHVLELGALAPRTAYARVTVNGQFYGFMGVFERIAQDYVKDQGWDHEGYMPLGYMYKGTERLDWLNRGDPNWIEEWGIDVNLYSLEVWFFVELKLRLMASKVGWFFSTFVLRISNLARLELAQCEQPVDWLRTVDLVCDWDWLWRLSLQWRMNVATYNAFSFTSSTSFFFFFSGLCGGFRFGFFFFFSLSLFSFLRCRGDTSNASRVAGKILSALQRTTPKTFASFEASVQPVGMREWKWSQKNRMANMLWRS